MFYYGLGKFELFNKFLLCSFIIFVTRCLPSTIFVSRVFTDKLKVIADALAKVKELSLKYLSILASQNLLAKKYLKNALKNVGSEITRLDIYNIIFTYQWKLIKVHSRNFKKKKLYIFKL